MSGFLVFNKKDDEGNTIAVDLSTGEFHRLSPKPPAPLPAQEPQADNDGCFKALILLIAVGAAAVMGFMPRSAYACGLLEIDCLFGFSNRTQIRADRDIDQARIEAAAAAEIARIQGEADARIRQAEAEVERVRQLQFQSEADRDIAIAQANAKAEEYKAMIAGLTDERITAIDAQASTQITALQEQSKIAIEGIVQTGKTERWRVAFGWATVIAVVIALAFGWYNWLRRTQSVMVLPEQPTARRLPWSDKYDRIEIVEVRHANTITHKH